MNLRDDDIILAGALRTPIGKFGGSFRPLSAPALGARAAAAAMKRCGVLPEFIEEVIFGHGRQAGNRPNPARQVGHLAGIAYEIPAYTVNQACASGMKSIINAARMIKLKEASIVLAGGMESMSNTPFFLTDARWGQRLGPGKVVDGMYHDGFLCPLCDQLMGETAENLADRYGIGRAEQDDYAAASQQRCQAARAAGQFDAEMAPVEVLLKKGASRLVEADEHPRDDVTPESLAKLPPVFRAEGTVHAGNSSGITDGAAAVVVLSGAAAKQYGIKPDVRIVDYAIVGVDPAFMGIGPVPAVQKLLAKQNLAIEDIDLWELNEAFAVQVLACLRELPIDRQKLNVNGGAIAIGHPIGATGARITVTLIHEMKKRQSRLGVATLCVSGGMGLALLVEKVE